MAALARSETHTYCPYKGDASHFSIRVGGARSRDAIWTDEDPYVGNSQTLAGLLQEWQDETDVDGFDLAYAVTPETFEDVATHLVPELQRRGLYKRDYAPGTLREKLFGRGALLPETHSGAGYRDLGAAAEPRLSAAK